MKTKNFVLIVICVVLSIFFTSAEASETTKEDKRISPWNAEDVQANIVGQMET